MHIHVADMAADQLYHILTQTVIPRPVAWVITDNGAGEGIERYNLAPFSFFNAMASDPPMLAFAISRKSDGSKKDTWVNLEEQKHCTVHIGNLTQQGDVIDSSAELPHGTSELLRRPYQLEAAPSGHSSPRLANAPVAFHCTLDHMHPLGKGTTAVAFCRIDHIFISDALVEKSDNGRITVDAAGVNPIMRLGGRQYASLGEITEHARPKE